MKSARFAGYRSYLGIRGQSWDDQLVSDNVGIRWREAAAEYSARRNVADADGGGCGLDEDYEGARHVEEGVICGGKVAGGDVDGIGAGSAGRGGGGGDRGRGVIQDRGGF